MLCDDCLLRVHVVLAAVSFVRSSLHCTFVIAHLQLFLGVMVLITCEQCQRAVGLDCGDGTRFAHDDNQKLLWFRRAIEAGWTEPGVAPPSDRIAKVVSWLASSSPQERIAFRESMVRSLEKADASQRQSGLLDSWYDGVNLEIRKVRFSCHFRQYASRDVARLVAK